MIPSNSMLIDADRGVWAFCDGDMFCAVFSDFENIQESPIGFGKSVSEAWEELLRLDREEDSRIEEAEEVRSWDLDSERDTH